MIYLNRFVVFRCYIVVVVVFLHLGCQDALHRSNSGLVFKALSILFYFFKCLNGYFGKPLKLWMTA